MSSLMSSSRENALGCLDGVYWIGTPDLPVCPIVSEINPAPQISKRYSKNLDSQQSAHDALKSRQPHQ